VVGGKAESRRGGGGVGGGGGGGGDGTVYSPVDVAASFT